MVRLKESTLIITAECKNPLESLNQLRNAITVVTTVLIESDEFYYHQQLPEAISSQYAMYDKFLEEKCQI